MFASISQVAFCPFGKSMLCCYEETNQAWDERPLCRVIPSALAQPCVVQVSVVPKWFQSTFGALHRGTKVRCAPVVPCRAFPTPRSMKARYAACDSGQRDPAERSCSYQFQRGRLCASTLLCIKARAQPARAADAAPRRARSCVFQRPFLLQCGSHQSVAAPLTRNSLGHHQLSASLRVCF